jgi:uncharacterized tellurite resistance protein B-like protein
MTPLFLHFLQTKQHKEAFLALADAIIKADGFITKNERSHLKSFLNEMEMTETDYQPKEVKDISEIVGSIDNDQVKHIFLAEMFLLIYADGNYAREEKQIVKEMQRVMGISDETVHALKEWVIQMDQLKINGLKIILGQMESK